MVLFLKTSENGSQITPVLLCLMQSWCELSGCRAQGVGGPAPEVDFYSHLVYRLLPLLTGLNTKLGIRECGNLPNQDHFDLCSVPASAYY